VSECEPAGLAGLAGWLAGLLGESLALALLRRWRVAKQGSTTSTRRSDRLDRAMRYS